MPTVNIYDKTGKFIESHEIEGSFLQWIKDTCPDYKDQARPPYSAELNGLLWPYSKHSEPLSSDDVVSVTIEPADPITATLTVIAILSAAYSYYVASNIPSYEENREQGTSIYSASARGNSVSPSGVVREIAGKLNVFPDLICLPRRKYIDNEEWLFLNMAVTRGYMDIQEQNVYIAETPIINYQGDYILNIAEPLENISSFEAHENWFESREISDLDLTTATGLIGGDWTVDYLNDTITSYLGGTATEFPFVAGEDFEIIGGSNEGIYKVVSVAGVDNEIATVQLLGFNGGAESRLETLSQQVSVRSASATSILGRRPSGRVRLVGLTPELSLTLNPATGEAITEWYGLNGGVNWEGAFTVCPENELASKIEVDVTFPQGLVRLDGNNNPEESTVQIAIHWRDRGTTRWEREIIDVTDATFNEHAFTYVIQPFSPITPEIRFRRVTKDSDEITIQDKVSIKRVKCLLSSPSVYQDVTTIQLAIRGTNALAVSAENRVNIRGATRKLPTLQEIEDAANGTPYDLSKSNTVQSTPWDIRNSIYTNAESFGGTESDYDQALLTYGSISFSSDGLNLLVRIDNYIRFYTLPEPFNIKQAIYTGNIQSQVGSNTNSCVRVVNGGLTVYSLESFKSPAGAILVESTLTGSYTPSVASSQVLDFIATPLPEVTSSVTSLFVSDSGAKMWMLLLGDDVLQYSMSTPFDLSTLTYDSVSLDVSTELTDCEAIYFGDSGARMFILGGASGYVYSYTLSTPNDLSTATYDGYFTSKPSDLGGNLKDINVLFGYMFVSNTENLSPEPKENTDANMSIGKWIVPDVTDTRASRSAVRFAASAIYDAVGSDYNDLVDNTALSALDTLLDGRQDYLDAEFVEETTLWEALKIMLSVGYSEPVIKEGVFTAIRTAAGSDYTNLYTPDIMIGDGLQVDQKFYDSNEPDGVDIEYFDLDTGSMELVEYRLAGDLGLAPKRIQSVGITDSDKAWRYAARERRRLRVKPNTYTFTTELDALNSNYGDPIGVASDIFGGEYGHVLDVDGSTVTLDFEPSIDGTESAVFRDIEGVQSAVYLVESGANPNEIELISPATLDFPIVTDPDLEPTLITIGKFNEFVRRAIVRRISPDGESSVQVTAEEYVDSIYADDDNLPS